MTMMNIADVLDAATPRDWMVAYDMPRYTLTERGTAAWVIGAATEIPSRLDRHMFVLECFCQLRTAELHGRYDALEEIERRCVRWIKKGWRLRALYWPEILAGVIDGGHVLACIDMWPE